MDGIEEVDGSSVLLQPIMAPAVGLEPQAGLPAEKTEPSQNRAKSIQFNALPDSVTPPQKQKSTLSQHNPRKKARSKCAICVQQNQSTIADDLAQVVAAWDNLPGAVKAGILAMVEAAGIEPGRLPE